MDASDRAGIEDAFATANAHTSAVVMGYFALCNELAGRGVIDADALDRMEAFMLGSLQRSGAETDAMQQLKALYQGQFQTVRGNLP